MLKKPTEQLEDFYDDVCEECRAAVLTKEELEEVMDTLERWDGQDVEDVEVAFNSINEVMRVFYNYPTNLHRLITKLSAQARKCMKKFKVDYEGTHPPYLKTYRPILQGLNGSLLWFNPHDNRFLVTPPPAEVS